MTMDTPSPDLLMTYHAGVTGHVDVDTWGSSYGWRSRFTNTGVDVRQYEGGTLIIDLIDAWQEILAEYPPRK
jgi:hypothetical protein